MDYQYGQQCGKVYLTDVRLFIFFMVCSFSKRSLMASIFLTTKFIQVCLIWAISTYLVEFIFPNIWQLDLGKCTKNNKIDFSHLCFVISELLLPFDEFAYTKK